MSGHLEIRCQVADVFDAPGVSEMMAEYEQECAVASLGGCRPSREIYERLEASNLAECLSAWWDGQLAGFGFVVFSTLPHYGREFAVVESIYAAKWARMYGVGSELMRELEFAVKVRGCQEIFYSARVGSDFERLLKARRCYEHTNTTFCRSLR